MPKLSVVSSESEITKDTLDEDEPSEAVTDTLKTLFKPLSEGFLIIRGGSKAQ